MKRRKKKKKKKKKEEEWEEEKREEKRSEWEKERRETDHDGRALCSEVLKKFFGVVVEFSARAEVDNTTGDLERGGMDE